MARGRTAAISACNQGEQARTSPAFGFWWMRFLPRGSHLKCFHRVGHVRAPPIDPGRLQRGVQQPPGRADERRAGNILLVAGLLADHHERGARLAGAEHRLRPSLPQRAPAAAARRLAQGGQRKLGRQVGARVLALCLARAVERRGHGLKLQPARAAGSPCP